MLSTAYASRSERGKLRLTGPQRGWFLHQILTQSLEYIAPGESCDAAMLTVHGRMVAYMEIVATDDALLLHFEPELRATLPDAVSRYVLATRVEIADVSDEMGLVLIAGPGWAKAASEAAPDGVAHPTTSLGTDAGYVWVSRAEEGRVLARLSEAGLKLATEDDLEAIRIANGVARWGYDMGPKTLPFEARIEERAIHLDKGCYVGQEAVAKIHFRGKVNRLLRRLALESPVEKGAEVILDEEPVGEVTSASGPHALAMLKHLVLPGAIVTVGGTRARVED